LKEKILNLPDHGSGLLAGRFRIRILIGARDLCCFLERSDRSSPMKKRPGRLADHWPLSHAKVNRWNFTSTRLCLYDVYRYLLPA
jgi:hypothetical protein